MRHPVCLITIVLALSIPDVDYLLAVTIVNDTFSDGDRADGPDPLDMAWYKNRSDITTTVANDPAIGDGNALFVDTMAVNAPISANYVAGVFPEVALGTTPGDQIGISYDFHLVDPVPADTDSNFRTSIFSSQGTAMTSDGNAFVAGQDDRGYGVGFEASTPIFGGSIKRHLGADVGGPGDIILPTTTSGPLPTLSDTATQHSASFTVTRLTGSSVEVKVTIDGFQAVTTDAAPNFIERFDEVVVRGSFEQNLDYVIDNVLVEQITIPEPSTLTLFFFSLLSLGMIGRRRRRR